MRHIFLSFILLLNTISSIAQNITWLQNIHGTGEIYPVKTVVNSSGEIYIFGRFDNSITSPSSLVSYGAKDLFLIKFDENGNYKWIRQIGGTLAEQASGMVIDNDGNIYLAGRFQGSCDFGGRTLNSTGGVDIFLAKFNPNGVLQWVYPVGKGNTLQAAQNLSIDKDGNLILIGFFQGSIDINGTVLSENLTSNTNFIAKFSLDANLIWAKKIVNKNSSSYFYGVSCSNDGYYFSASLIDTVYLDIAKVGSTKNDLNNYTFDILLYKTDFDGVGQWYTKIGGKGNDANISTESDLIGNVYVTGYFNSTDLKVDSVSADQNSSAVISKRISSTKGSNDIFFAKYSTNGILKWFDIKGSEGDDRLTRLNTNGNTIVIAGQYGATMLYNNRILNPIGGIDALNVVQDQNDNLLYAISAGGVDSDITETCLIDNEGNYFFIGDFTSSTIYFDQNNLISNPDPGKDVFIAKYKARSISFVTDSVLCPGTNTASVTANPEGAWSGNKTYLWSKEGDAGFTASTSTIDHIGAGIYTCSISDGTHSENASVTVVDPSPLSVTLKTKTDASCFGSATGHLEVNVTGGSGAKKYLWSGTGTGVVATNSIQNTLSAGTYSVTVTDKNGCPASLSNLTISEPKKINFKNTTVTNLNPSNGAVNLSVQEGTPGYSYNWTGPSGYTGATTEDLTGLTIAGLYSVTVNDARNCSADTSVLVALSSELRAYISQKQNVSCYGGNDGMLVVTAETGKATPNFEYSWSGPDGFTASTATIANLKAGTYTVTVTDINNAPDFYTINNIIVNQPTVLSLVTAHADASCTGISNGYIDVDPSGGALPYAYQWKKDGNTLAGNTEVLSDLAPGNYEVTVTDARNCSASVLTVINPASVINVDAVITNVTCIGTKNDGAIALNISGGSGTKTVRWSNGLTSNNISLLSPGTYICTVTDQNNCSVVTSHTVGQPSPITATFLKTNISCFGGSNGAIDLTPSGGNGSPYSFKWEDNSVNEDRSGLSAGTYSVTITDSRKCEKTLTETLTEPQELNVTASLIQNVNCNGKSNGSISISTTGGTLPYNWVWSDTQTGPVASGLAAGTYSVTVTDNNSCSKTASFDVTEPSPLVISEVVASHTNVLCHGLSTGILEASASGSSGTYQYSIDGNTWKSSGSFSGIPAGVYTVVVRDQDVTSCTSALAPVTITEPQAIAFTAAEPTNITCFGLTNGSINSTANGGTGTLAYKLFLNDVETGNVSGASSGNFTGLGAGSYKVEVTDANNCGPVLSSVLTITEPQAIAFTAAEPANITCFGLTNGSINSTANGGTGTLSYKLLLNDVETGNVSGSTSGNFTGLGAGSYKVEVTDANNCGPVLSSVLTITEPQAIAFTAAEAANITCFGLTNGSINSTANGGTGTLSYKLLLNDVETGNVSGSTSGNFTGLGAGSYKVEVTNANNCGPVLSSVLTITEPQTIAFTAAEPANITCFGLTNGSINSTANGGTGTLAYKLLLNDVETGNVSGASSGNFTGLGAGSYKVEVTDANNCDPVLSSVLTITEPQTIAFTAAEPANITCFGLTNGSINSTANGGTGTLAYKLLLNDVETGNVSGASSGNFTGLGAGSYKVEVTDANNCDPILTSELTITEPQAITFRDIVLTNITCSGLNNGSINAPASGGTGTLIYHLDLNGTETGNLTGQNNGLFTGLTAGTSYEVKVSDAKNCTLSTENQSIQEPSAITINNLLGSDITCPGLNNGIITVNATGGTGILTYRLLLNDNQTDNNTGSSSGHFTGLAPGNGYNIEILDENNCGPVKSSVLDVHDARPITINNITASDITCSDLHNGTINLQASGGKQPLSYRLLLNQTPVDNSSGASSGVFSDVVEGKGYNVQITDANNCGPVYSTTVNILKPLPVTITSEITTRTTGAGRSDGSVNIEASGGTGVLTYKLNTGTVQNSGLFSGLPRGTYTVVVSDANNCSPVSSSSLIVDDLTAVEAIRGGNIYFYPNPAYGKIFLKVTKTGFTELKIEIRSITGQAALVKKFENVTDGFMVPVDVSQLPRGIYIILVNNSILNDKLILQ